MRAERKLYWKDQIEAENEAREKEMQDEIIANQTTLAGIQTKAATDNVEIQWKLVILNRWIAFAASVAAFYYIIQIFDYVWKLFSSE